MVNTFVIGAPKCGTSTLYEIFKQVDIIEVSKIKETHFFSNEKVDNSYYNVQPIRDLSKYYENFKFQKDIVVDFSPSYFNNDIALKRISQYNSTCKLIILYRNPISRAISHYSMDKNLGFNTCNSLLESLKIPKYFDEYINNSLYNKRTISVLKYFNMDNILFLNIKDLNDKEYLKLSFENFFQKKFFFKPKILVSNKGYRYKADWIRKSIKLIPKEFKSLIPSRFKLFIKSKVITSKNTRYIPTQEELIILHELLDEDYSLFENKYLK